MFFVDFEKAFDIVLRTLLRHKLFLFVVVLLLLFVVVVFFGFFLGGLLLSFVLFCLFFVCFCYCLLVGWFVYFWGGGFVGWVFLGGLQNNFLSNYLPNVSMP